MAKDTSITLDFQGHPIRVVNRLVPVNDISDTLGRDRQAVTRLIDRDAVLSSMRGVVVMATPGGNQGVTCLPYEGTLLLLAKLNASRSKTPAAQAFLVSFQIWAANTLKAVLLGEPIPAPSIEHRPRLSGALLGRMKDHLGHQGTTEAMIRIWPEWFANLPGERPRGPQQVVQPTLGLTEPLRLELRQVEA